MPKLMERKPVKRKNDVTVERHDIDVTKVFRMNAVALEQTVVHKGGAGSSKSYALCQFFIYNRLFNPKLKNYRGLICRKTLKSLRLSTYRMFIEILESSGLYFEREHNKSDMIIRNPETGGYILFAGFDNRERIKSTEWHDIWMEEGNEFVKEDYTFNKTRLFRGKITSGIKPQIRISYNPVMCWIQGMEGKPGVKVIHSTYKDNPFCNEEYKATLESLKDEDPVYYKIYALGQDAEPEHLIYSPYTMIDHLPETYDDVIYGLDFGFNKPTALIKIGITDAGLYLQQLIYKTHLTNPDKIALMKEVIPEELRDKPIYADSEDPVAIQEIAQAGFNIIPADKKPGSVKAGIDFCKRRKFFTVEENYDLNKERSTYKWRVDRAGNVMDEPVKFRDHFMDGKRYAIFTHFVGQGEPESIKKALDDIKSSPDSESSRADWELVR